MVSVLMLLIAVPLAVYANLAVRASRDVRERQALARSLFAAQQAAHMLDLEGTNSLPVPPVDDVVRFWVADRAGHVVTPPARSRSLSDYTPFRMALGGVSGSVRSEVPGTRKPAIVGYAPATRAGRIVLAVQDLDDVDAPDQLLVHLLSFLLAPVLILLLPTVWILVGLLQRERAMVRQLGVQNDRLREVDQARAAFLASVSHDLRTPLAAMHLSLSGLLEDATARALQPVWTTVRGAIEEIDRMAARVRNLLDLARLEAAGAPAVKDVCDLTDIVGEALDRVRPMMAGRPLATDFPPQPLLVECDHAQMQTVIINLIENALKYSPKETPIRLKGECLTGQAVLTVSDEGPGVHPGDEDRVFERFYRAPGAAASGSGLGLAICKTVVEWHGGNIGVRPANGGGAAFWVSLPSIEAEDEG